ncbi:MAG: hypothetical protein CBB68_05080 [Rhodospirillaceae bacterium TMED8]|nr:hypothetical protein [Magnetovibrio sp.]OUT51699.1 MAG: hypothetical protein CBB68_05080 [Rhodospirillaceae bacterium TMED8]
MRLIITCLITLFSIPVSAAEIKLNISKSIISSTEADILSVKARHVEVYAVIDRIYDIKISDGSYKIEAEILLKWNKPQNQKKLEALFKKPTYAGKHAQDILDKIWHPEFVVKAEIIRRETLFTTVHINQDGSLELFEKFRTTLPINTDIRTYPFGTLKLNLDIVAFTHGAEEMTFDPQSFKLGHEDQEEPVIVGNWTLVNAYADKKVSHRLSTKDQTFSQNGFHFIIEHDFHDSMQKIFFPLGGIIFISLFLNLFSSMRFEANIDMRVMGQLTLLLTVFALKFTLGDQVPHTHYLNLVDLLFIIGTGIVFLNFFVSVVMGDIFLRRGGNERIIQIESIIDRLIPILTIILIVAAFYSVYQPENGGLLELPPIK